MEEQTVRIAQIAVRRGRQPAAARQRDWIDLNHMALCAYAAVTVFALRVGDEIGAVFQIQAHARDTQFFRILNMVVVTVDKYFTDHARFLSKHAAAYLRLCAVSAISLLRADPNPHAIAVAHRRLRRNRWQLEPQLWTRFTLRLRHWRVVH